MKPARPAGFTLAEVLVAVALAGLIFSVAVAVLHTTRQVAGGVQQPLFQEQDAFLSTLRGDLDRLIPSQVYEDVLPLTLSEDEGLTLVALLRNAQGIPQPTRLHYVVDGSSLLRIAQGGVPSLTTTNQVLSSVSRLQWQAYQKGTATSEWPTEEFSGVPARMEVRVTRLNAPDLLALLDLPASFAVEARTVSEENN